VSKRKGGRNGSRGGNTPSAPAAPEPKPEITVTPPQELPGRPNDPFIVVDDSGSMQAKPIRAEVQDLIDSYPNANVWRCAQSQFLPWADGTINGGEPNLQMILDRVRDLRIVDCDCKVLFVTDGFTSQDYLAALREHGIEVVIVGKGKHRSGLREQGSGPVREFYDFRTPNPKSSLVARATAMERALFRILAESGNPQSIAREALGLPPAPYDQERQAPRPR